MGVSVEQVDRQDHLHQVGADRAVGDLDTDRGRVEPEVYCRWDTASMSSSTGTNSSLAVGYLIDDEDCRLSQARNVVQKTFNGVFAAAVVSMTAGSESRSAVSRRSA